MKNINHFCHCLCVSEKPLIISFEGASGDYPGCTNLAYERAISDGANVIDCPVQMTWDKIPICLGSINLINSTTVLQSRFRNSITSVPELGGQGIYSFDLTWGHLQTLKREFLTQRTYHQNSISIVFSFLILPCVLALRPLTLQLKFQTLTPNIIYSAIPKQRMLANS